MANYFVVGGDSKEYGPVTEAEVRQWIAEGRLSSESQVKAESDAEFRRLALFPEFASDLKPGTEGAPVTPPPPPENILDRDYELDIGGCIARGWEVYKENFAALFLGVLIVFVIQIACGAVLNMPLGKLVLEAPVGVRIAYGGLYPAVLGLINGPLWGGLFLVYLQTIRGQKTGMGELFAGFQRAYLQLFLGALVLSLINFVCMLPFQVVWQASVGPLFAQMQHMQNDPTGIQNLLPQLMSGFTHSLPVLCLCLVPVTFFTVSFQFTSPLIIDRGMTFGQAMKLSWHMVFKHWWLLFGLTVVAGLIAMAGLLGCCVGVLFTAPIGLAAMMIAYETIFGVARN
jgi:hypothetical protein